MAGEGGWRRTRNGSINFDTNKRAYDLAFITSHFVQH